MIEVIDGMAVMLDERVSMVAILERNAVNHAEAHAGLELSEWRMEGWVSTLQDALGIVTLRRIGKPDQREQRVLYDWADWQQDRYGEPFPVPGWVRDLGKKWHEHDR